MLRAYSCLCTWGLLLVVLWEWNRFGHLQGKCLIHCPISGPFSPSCAYKDVCIPYSGDSSSALGLTVWDLLPGPCSVLVLVGLWALCPGKQGSKGVNSSNCLYAPYPGYYNPVSRASLRGANPWGQVRPGHTFWRSVCSCFSITSSWYTLPVRSSGGSSL